MTTRTHTNGTAHDVRANLDRHGVEGVSARICGACEHCVVVTVGSDRMERVGQVERRQGGRANT